MNDLWTAYNILHRITGEWMTDAKWEFCESDCPKYWP